MWIWVYDLLQYVYECSYWLCPDIYNVINFQIYAYIFNEEIANNTFFCWCSWFGYQADSVYEKVMSLANDTYSRSSILTKWFLVTISECCCQLFLRIHCVHKMELKKKDTTADGMLYSANGTRNIHTYQNILQIRPLGHYQQWDARILVYLFCFTCLFTLLQKEMMRNWTLY